MIETMVTIFVYGLVMIAAAQLLLMTIGQPGQRFASLGSIDQVRKLGAMFNNEIRNAQSGQDGSYAISQASSTQIVLFTSYDSGTSTVVDRVRYYLSGGTLYKGVVVPSGNPPAYNLASEIVVPVVTKIVSSAVPVFAYYDGTYAGTSSPLAQPVNVTQVEFAQVNLTVYQQDARGATTTYTFATGAAVRSLKTNLGN